MSSAPIHLHVPRHSQAQPPIKSSKAAPSFTSAGYRKPVRTGSPSASSRSSSQVRPRRARPVQDANSGEYTSEKATATLIRRVLGPQTGAVDPRNSPKPIEDILPPLTSSNEVDLQLYALIAIVVKEFIQVWYSKITLDRVFVEEVVHIIAHCSRAIEQRLRRMDVEELLYDEIPALVEAHVLGESTRRSSPSMMI
jgi:PXA domain